MITPSRNTPNNKNVKPDVMLVSRDDNSMKHTSQDGTQTKSDHAGGHDNIWLVLSHMGDDPGREHVKKGLPMLFQ